MKRDYCLWQAHAVHSRELGRRLDYSKLHFPMSALESTHTGRMQSMMVIFHTHFSLVLLDIMKNDECFVLPKSGRALCRIRMKRIQGERFMKFYKSHTWKGLDLLACNKEGATLTLEVLKKNGRTRVVDIHISELFTSWVTENLNKGFNYGSAKPDKTYKDYSEAVHELYPKIPIEDINYIVRHFYYRLGYYLAMHLDYVTIARPPRTVPFTIFIGDIPKDFKYASRYFTSKMLRKLAIMYHNDLLPKEDYMYVGLTESEHLQFLREKHIELPHSRLGYRVKEAGILMNARMTLHLYRVPYSRNGMFKYRYRSYDETLEYVEPIPHYTTKELSQFFTPYKLK